MSYSLTEKIMNGHKRIQEGFSDLKGRLGRPGKEEILEGNILKVMFKLGWPIMIATFLRTLYNLADTVWLGRLTGPEATYSVAAASQAWSVVFIIMSVEIGFGVAALALISQYIGSDKFDKASEYAGQIYFLAITFSILFAAIGYLGTPYLLDLLTGAGAEGEALASYGTDYLRIIFLGLPFMFLFFVFMFVMRGRGDNVTPMKIVAVAAVLNIIVDPILILGSGHAVSLGSLEFTIPTLFGYPIPSLGIRGAAIATVVTRALGALYSVHLIFSNKLEICMDPSYLIPDVSKIKKILTVSIPSSFGRFGEALGFLILWAVVYRLPNPDVAGAAYGAGNRILNITFLVIGGVSMAMSTMIGQSLGAEMQERTEKVARKGLITLAVLGAAIALPLFFARNVLIEFVVPGQEAVISTGGELLMIFSLSLPFFCIFRGVTQIMAGSGHTFQQMILNLGRIWGLRLVFVFLFALWLGMNDTGVWMGLSVSNLAAAGIALFVYSFGWWKEKVIEEAPTVKPKIPVEEEAENTDSNL
ncbi:MAG: MATE family efflux transporter [Candidatus Hadarchaeota archaeon]